MRGEREPLIAVEQLYKVFGPRPHRAIELVRQGKQRSEIFEGTGLTIAVENATFAVEAGEVFVIMGLSGSGKSTLLRMINRLIEPTAGRVLIEGRDVTRMSQSELRDLRRKRTSMVFQHFALMPHLKVWENAAFALDVAGSPRRERRERALEVLELVGLTAYADSRPQELSGGMQQRVGLARALAGDPDLMLMDEAFSALDPLIRTEMQDELLALQTKSPRTILFISHDLDEALRIGDRIAIMRDGRVVQVGEPSHIMQEPADDFVRAFFRGVDVAAVYTVGDIARNDQLTLLERPGNGVLPALQLLRDENREFGYVKDRRGRFRGVVSADSLGRQLGADHPSLEGAFLTVEPLRADAPVSEVIDRVAHAPCPVPVVRRDERLAGTVSKVALLETLDRHDAA